MFTTPDRHTSAPHGVWGPPLYPNISSFRLRYAEKYQRPDLNAVWA
jgi:hypothetical protein